MLWPLFIACTVLVAVVWLSGFGPGMLADENFGRGIPKEAREALGILSRALDPIWITLGAVVAYLALVRAEGLSAARRWSGLVLVAGFVIGTLSALTRLPLGPVYYPTNLGMKLGPVPFGVPFLWLVIVLGARETVLRVFPKLSHGGCAALTGVCCGLTSVLLDPIAWKYRAWWLWYPAQFDAPGTAPWSAHLTWFVAGAALAFAMRAEQVVPRVKVRPIAPMLGYLFLIAIIALTRVVR